MVHKRGVCIILTLLVLLSCGLTTNVSAQEQSGSVLAHWKLQDNPAYYAGDIDADDLIFTDLSGNGNHLEIGVEGNGAKLDIFKWEKGVHRTTLKSDDSRTSLLFDNSLDKAKNVDPFDPTQTLYSGAYVSGKYLHTVSGAPLNSFTGKGGWTIEVIFKISPEWSNIYNRYTGIFSRQGVVKACDEPALSLALSDAVSTEGEKELLGKKGRAGLQYIFVNEQGGLYNNHLAGESIKAGVWCHYMVTSSESLTTVYLNGQEIKNILHPQEFFVVDDSFGWEVGVGRKLKGNEATMNEEYPEGLIRRLFCGSISEIRFSSGTLTVNESLLRTAEEPLPTTTTTTTTTTAKATTTSTTVGNITTTAKKSSTTVSTDAATDASQSASATTTTVNGDTITIGTGSLPEASDADATTSPNLSTTTSSAGNADDSTPTSGIWIAIIVVVVIAVIVAVVLPFILRKKQKK